jgi:hypothetical protein
VKRPGRETKTRFQKPGDFGCRVFRFNDPLVMKHLPSIVAVFCGALLLGCDSDAPRDDAESLERTSRSVSASASDDPTAVRPKRPSVFSQSSDETRELLKTLVLDELNFDEVPLPEAIHEINRLLGKKYPSQKRPKICLADEWANDPSQKIRTLRLRNAPLGIALKYICDQTRCVFWVYQGTVYLDVLRFDGLIEERFLHQTRIPALDIPDASLAEALEVLRSAVDKIDFNGRKPPITIRSISAKWNEVETPNTAQRIRGVSLREVTLSEALAEICKQTGTQQEVWEGEIVLTHKPSL